MYVSFIYRFKDLRSGRVARLVEEQVWLRLVAANPRGKPGGTKGKARGAGSLVARKALKLYSTILRSQPELSLRATSGSMAMQQ